MKKNVFLQKHNNLENNEEDHASATFKGNRIRQ